jgi:hypothetical protein
MAVNRAVTEEKFEVVVEDDSFDIDARPSQSKSTSSAITAGWDGAEALTVNTSKYPEEFKQQETPQIIKIIDGDGPFAAYKVHFLSQKTEGKRSYVCLDPQFGKDCPLCTVLNHKPEVKRSFTIVNFSATPFQRQILTVTPRLYKTIHAAHFSPQGPLGKPFWALGRTGVKQSTIYNFTAVKPRDLDEDWNISAVEAEAFLANVEPYTSDVIHEHSYADLLEIANDLI